MGWNERGGDLSFLVRLMEETKKKREKCFSLCKGCVCLSIGLLFFFAVLLPRKPPSNVDFLGTNQTKAETAGEGKGLPRGSKNTTHTEP